MVGDCNETEIRKSDALYMKTSGSRRDVGQTVYWAVKAGEVSLVSIYQDIVGDACRLRTCSAEVAL